MKKATNIKDFFSKYYVFVLLVFVFLILFAVSLVYYSQLRHHTNYKNPEAIQGVFDYTDIDFNKQKYTGLHGEVEFYWDQLLTPEDFGSRSDSLQIHYIEIPEAWNRFTVDGKTIGSQGYGTYHFKILVNSPGLYSLKIKEFESAFNIWINSKDYGGAGTVASNKKDMVPSWRRQEFNFYVDNDSIDVILQISNYQHRLGGASEIILFGLERSIRTVKTFRMIIEAFLMGILAILLIYHLTIYHYRKADKSVYYFSLAAFFFILRLSTTGEKLLLDIFSFIPWSVAIRIEYISIPLIGYALINFIYDLLPQNIPVWFKRSINIIALVLSVIVIFLPASIFTYIAIITPILTAYLVIGMFTILLKAVIQKKENALGLFGGFLLLFGMMINDVLFYFNIVESAYLLPFGLIILMLTQAFIISRNSSLAYRKVEELSKELEKHAEELEVIVDKRTLELKKQAKTLDETNKKLIELDTFKKEMTRMMVHDLKNPLSNMIGLIQLPELTNNIRELVSHSGNEMQNLIQNILDVTKFEETKLELYPGSAMIYDLTDAAYRQNEFNISLNSIRFENMVPKDLMVTVDVDLFVRVFSNIISNAIKFQHGGGRIRVSSELTKEQNKKFCKISIFNNGEAIPEDKLEAIFDVYNQIYAQRGEFKYSTGIGLTFCKMVVEAHGGKIAARNEKNGVTFWFTIPVDKA